MAVCVTVTYIDISWVTEKDNELSMDGIIGLAALAIFVLAVLGLFQGKGYRCSECSYWSPDRQDAAGHQLLHSMHKMPL